MRGLTFRIDDAVAVPYAAVPTVAFRIRVHNPDPAQEIQSIALRCQILIEASRRHYTPAERDSLRDLFGDPDRWSQTLKSLLWTHVSTTIPTFSGDIATEIPVPCSFDFNIGASKYFHAIQNEAIPLLFQFSGTVFYPAPDGALQISQIGWDKEATFRLPASVWREMMDHYYPNSAWLRIARDTFERLYAYKRANSMSSWEEALESLLPLTEKVAS